MKSWLYPITNFLLDRYASMGAKTYDIHNTIVISGCPRSGTTWLAEILNTIPNSNILMEPLHLRWVPEAKDIGFSGRTHIEPNEDWPEAEDFMKRVLSGQIMNINTLLKVKPMQILKNRNWIVKFVRANRMLRWIVENFPIRPPILLIRHPCAVVSSQMYIPSSWGNSKPSELARSWCYDYSIPLSSPKPHPWILVSYERLVREKEAEIKRIFKVLGFDVPKAAMDLFRRPSSTTRKDSPVRQGLDPLTDWKSHLTEEQVKHILGIVKGFGLDFYNEDPEPDYEWLRAYSNN